jgi:hypothetical protein
MGTGGSFSGDKAAGREADHSPSASAKVKKNVDLYMHSPIRLHGVVPNWLGTGTTLPPLPYLLLTKIPLVSNWWFLLVTDDFIIALQQFF